MAEEGVFELSGQQGVFRGCREQMKAVFTERAPRLRNADSSGAK